MKKLTLSLIAMTILFAFSGCEKDPTKPGEDNDIHPMVWQYEYGQDQIRCDVIPAMDESGNIFFSIQEQEDGAQNVYVFANDKDGNALWDKQFSSSNNVQISHVMYIDNKLIFVVHVVDNLSYYQETIYCLDAVSGSEIWHYSPDFINERRIEAMALTSDYLVVGAEWGGDYPAIDELHYFDLSSGALVKSVDLGDNEVKIMSIVGNSVYLGSYSIASKSYYTPKIMKMDLESNVIEWTFHGEYLDETTYIFEQRSLPVDANGRVFFLVGEIFGSGTSNMYIVNNSGQLENTVTIPLHNSGRIYNVLIDKENHFYSAINTFSKYTAQGSKVWEFHSGTQVMNSNFSEGCVLGDNDIVYHAENGGILNVNTEGEIAWAKYHETNFTKPGYPLLTNEGNMVVVGDLYVSCVKGDGAKIQNAPWPRVYQNNGNTSSR